MAHVHHDVEGDPSMPLDVMVREDSATDHPMWTLAGRPYIPHADMAHHQSAPRSQ